MAKKQAPTISADDKSFSARLKDLMSEALWITGSPITQEQLASAAGVSRQTISNYINGQSTPDCDILMKIAKYFDVSADYLVGLYDERTSDKDVRAVCDYTGLNEYAVEKLHSIKDDQTIKNICKTTIFDRDLNPELAKECLNDFLADDGYYSIFACLANLRECYEIADKTISRIEDGDYNHTITQQRTALENALRTLEIGMFHLTESVRYIAETETDYSNTIYRIHKLLNSIPQTELKSKGGAQDAENSPES